MQAFQGRLQPDLYDLYSSCGWGGGEVGRTAVVVMYLKKKFSGLDLLYDIEILHNVA